MANVRVERTEDGGFVATNARGAEVRMGGGTDEGVFTPVELLLAALGGCHIVTVEPLTAKRGQRLVRLAMEISADKAEPNRLGPITVRYDVELPSEEADEVFRAVAHRVHEKYCTVGRSLEEGTEVRLDIP
ncbi:OsmC family protein [Nonomuraea sp. MCN248]|uniref:OsmC family protein n=1 Tax=Nonomuraea corallina TaxID=2989783 RepID=A0ABT4SFK4_9ACTN|nr:OsmC family protein [Nonomuraea corallina]MDA0635977.1 OsmC family protein [Nonomuraea corallina]